MDLEPRQVALIGLVAIVPGGIFAIETGEYVVAIALVNVVLIVASLVYAMTDSEGTETPPSNGDPVGQ